MPLFICMQQWVLMLLLVSASAHRQEISSLHHRSSRIATLDVSAIWRSNASDSSSRPASFAWPSRAPLKENDVRNWITNQTSGALEKALHKNKVGENEYLDTMKTAMAYIDDADQLRNNGIYIPHTTIMKIYRMNAYDPVRFFGGRKPSKKSRSQKKYQDGSSSDKNYLETHCEEVEGLPYVWVESLKCTSPKNALKSLRKPLRRNAAQVDPVGSFDKVYKFPGTNKFPTTNWAVAKDVIPACLHAFWKATPTVLIPYGQSGSGKTYSFVGDQTAPGIVPRLMNAIFGLLLAQEKHYMVTIQFGQNYRTERIDMLLATHDIVFPETTAWVFDLRKRNMIGAAQEDKMTQMYPLYIVQERVLKCDSKGSSGPCDYGMGPFFEDQEVWVRDAYGRKIKISTKSRPSTITAATSKNTAKIKVNVERNGGTLAKEVRDALVEHCKTISALAEKVGLPEKKLLDSAADANGKIFQSSTDVGKFLQRLAQSYTKKGDDVHGNKLWQASWFISGEHWDKAYLDNKIPTGLTKQDRDSKQDTTEMTSFRDGARDLAMKRIEDIVRIQALAVQANKADPGKIMEDEVTTPIQKLTPSIVKNWEELKKIWDQAMKRRVTVPTGNNAESSRSVLTGKITVYWQKYSEKGENYAISTIVFQDLPGSESADMTAHGDKEIRRKEGDQIRKDIQNLGMLLGNHKPASLTNVVKDVMFIQDQRITKFVLMALTAKKNHKGARQTLEIAHRASSGFMSSMERPRLVAWLRVMHAKYLTTYAAMAKDSMPKGVFEEVCREELKQSGKEPSLLKEIMDPVNECSNDVVDVECLVKKRMWSNSGFKRLLGTLARYQEKQINAGIAEDQSRKTEQVIGDSLEEAIKGAQTVGTKVQTWLDAIGEKIMELKVYVNDMKTAEKSLQEAEELYTKTEVDMPPQLKKRVDDVKTKTNTNFITAAFLKKLEDATVAAHKSLEE